MVAMGKIISEKMLGFKSVNPTYQITDRAWFWWPYRDQMRNRVSSPNLGTDATAIRETRLEAWPYLVGMRNRVSSPNLGSDATAI